MPLNKARDQNDYDELVSYVSEHLILLARDEFETMNFKVHRRRINLQIICIVLL